MFQGAFRGVVAGVLMFLIGGSAFPGANPKAVRSIALASGPASFEGALEAGEVRFDAELEDGAFYASLRPVNGILSVHAGRVGYDVLSLTVSSSGEEVRQTAALGDVASVQRIAGSAGALTAEGPALNCARLAADPSFVALQRINADLGRVAGDLRESDLWLAHLLGQLEQTLALAPGCAGEHLLPASGQCSIQPYYTACISCCDVNERLSAYMVAACENSLRGAGGISGGFGGGFLGGLVGDLICTPMMHDQDCYSRCTGKDGDPDPIPCFDSGAPEEVGVCRQVCEMGQHDIGFASCPTGGAFPLRCCLYEYDPPDDEPCPPSLCPGPACPTGCDDVGGQ